MTSFYEIIDMGLPITGLLMKESFSCLDEIVIEFDHRIYAVFTVNIDTDELIYETKNAIEKKTYQDACMVFPYLNNLLGEIPLSAWIMTRANGATDAFQLEFNEKDDSVVAIQAIVFASSFQIFQFIPLTRESTAP